MEIAGGPARLLSRERFPRSRAERAEPWHAGARQVGGERRRESRCPRLGGCLYLRRRVTGARARNGREFCVCIAWGLDRRISVDEEEAVRIASRRSRESSHAHAPLHRGPHLRHERASHGQPCLWTDSEASAGSALQGAPQLRAVCLADGLWLVQQQLHSLGADLLWRNDGEVSRHVSSSGCDHCPLTRVAKVAFKSFLCPHSLHFFSRNLLQELPHDDS